MKMLIFGGNGYMGQHFRAYFPQAEAVSCDIADSAAVAKALDEMCPEVVINCAGKTGKPNVDWCEDHKAQTLHGNTLGPLVLLEECAKRNIYWVTLSTGCIYEGDNEGKGFSEDDPPNFFGSFYSRSKGWTDQILKEFPVLQLRLRMPFNDVPDPRNLITKLLKYEKVLDVPNSLTYVPDFLASAKMLIEKRATGIFNIVNPGMLSPYRVMELYKELVDPTHTFSHLTLKELPAHVKAGRSNCMLSSAKLEENGGDLQSIEEAMKKALLAYGKGGN